MVYNMSIQKEGSNRPFKPKDIKREREARSSSRDRVNYRQNYDQNFRPNYRRQSQDR